MAEEGVPVHQAVNQEEKMGHDQAGVASGEQVPKYDSPGEVKPSLAAPCSELKKTLFLPPFMAISCVWARTSLFGVLDKDGKTVAPASSWVDESLKELSIKAKANDTDSIYFFSSMLLMDAAVRNLEIIYKGRQLNFDENETLRTAYLDAYRESVEFGKEARDYIKAIPTMALGGSAGGVLYELLDWPKGLPLVAVIFGFVALAFFLYLGWIYHSRNKKLNNYIRQDYERSLYYEHYLIRTKEVLVHLYNELNNLHKTIFSQPYATGADEERDLQGIDRLVNDVKPRVCEYMDKHISQGSASFELWSMCETGLKPELCPQRRLE